MYLKQSTYKNERTYLSINESYRDPITKKANRGKVTSYYIPEPTLHSLDGRYTQKKPILRKKEENL